MKEEKSIFDRPIKKHSTEEIQNTIAKAVSKLCGFEYKAEIKSINFNPDKIFLADDATEICLTIRHKSRLKQ